MSNAHVCNHMSAITIVVFSYHCHDSNTDNNESHYCYYLLLLVYQLVFRPGYSEWWLDSTLHLVLFILILSQ